MSIAAADFSPAEVHDLSAQFEDRSLTEVLTWAWEQFGTRAAIGTSFQGAGLVMIDHAVKAGLGLPIFTLDTQLLFPETYDLKRRLEDHFGVEIQSELPDQTPEEQAADIGPELWKTHPDTCCIQRKVIPLRRRLQELDAWITGLRRQQSDTREKTQILELYKYDVPNGLSILKINPMANWSRDKVWDHLKTHGIPYNPLHDRGYRSIGCQPCTRAVAEGDNERAGRWTGFDKAECGIHTFLGDSI